MARSRAGAQALAGRAMRERGGMRRAERGGGGVAVVLSAVLLSGAVSAVVAVAVVRLAPERVPAIASVRLGEIAAGYAVSAAGNDRSDEAAAADARAWGIALEAALDRVAQGTGSVLLPARAVAAGAPDVTETVEFVLRDRTSPRPRRAAFGLAVIVALGALWLAAASRVHVNTSWSDGAWGYLAIPLIGAPEVGDRVLFAPDVVGSEVTGASGREGGGELAAGQGRGGRGARRDRDRGVRFQAHAHQRSPCTASPSQMHRRNPIAGRTALGLQGSSCDAPSPERAAQGPPG